MRNSVWLISKLCSALIWFLLVQSVALSRCLAQSNHSYDAIIYSATPAGISAAVALRQEGFSALIVEPTKHPGGIITSGLGASDVCVGETVGGLARSFFEQVGQIYGKEISWRLEPHVAQEIFSSWLLKNQVDVLYETKISAVLEKNKSIQSIKVGSNRQLSARLFIDASYEGDLMALAKVAYVTGREAASDYGESLAGVSHYDTRDQFPAAVTGLDKEGKLLRWISAEPVSALGTGDSKSMAYNFRLCVTKNRENQVPFARPANYDPKDYRLLNQYIRAKARLKLSQLFVFLPLPNGKFDLNNKGPFSTDFIGQNWDYPEGNASKRAEIINAHAEYTRGLLYHLATDSSIPPHIQQPFQTLGLCKDEFVDNGNWPYQLYIREARRLKGEYFMTEKDLLKNLTKPDSIALGSCPIESHHVQRIREKDGTIKHEGWVSASVLPYQIPYRSIVPKREELTNLIVPVALSASHIAYSSVRMEPTFMALGQSAGLAGSIALKAKIGVQDVNFESLKALLLKYKQRIQSTPAAIKQARRRYGAGFLGDEQ